MYVYINICVSSTSRYSSPWNSLPLIANILEAWVTSELRYQMTATILSMQSTGTQQWNVMWRTVALEVISMGNTTC